ncbi:hypothetical protein HDU87_008814 [Geranomyces variabilis]|uniref:VASt domain-containing protein n=1 Tax=Geranomyces variabilis TaxID=109894 RepID=A0AAD5TEX0_9FUNG|nr:hypothetical protein HDU87_008814 [Geranomyces variabilis]
MDSALLRGPSPAPSPAPTTASSFSTSSTGRKSTTTPPTNWHATAPYFPFLDEVRATGERLGEGPGVSSPGAGTGGRRTAGRAAEDSSDEVSGDDGSIGSGSLGRRRGRRSLNRLRKAVNSSVGNLASTLGAGSTSSTTSTTADSQYAPRDAATGLALAADRDNAEFHRVFSTVPASESLIDDFACAWNREGLLIQGRMWISQQRVCFKGWTPNSNICIKFTDIISIEKKTIALVFSNSLEIECTKGKYFFASFFNRDQTYSTLTQLWDARQEPCTCGGLGTCETCYTKARKVPGYSSSGDEAKVPAPAALAAEMATAEDARGMPNSPSVRITRADGRESEETTFPTPPHTPVLGSRRKHSATAAQCECGLDHKRMRTILERVYSVPIEQVWETWFTAAEDATKGGFYPHFLLTNTKVKDFTTGVWVAAEATSDLSPLPYPADAQHTPDFASLKAKMHRSSEYIMPLTGPIGPKQTRCKITEELISATPDTVCVTVRADTPDVPSGGAFHVLTRICLTHVPPSKTRVMVSTEIVFTKSSWIKGAIERATPDAQARFYKELDEALGKKLAKIAAAEARGGEKVDTGGGDSAAATVPIDDVAANATSAPRSTLSRGASSTSIVDVSHDHHHHHQQHKRNSLDDGFLLGFGSRPVLVLLFVLIVAALCSLAMQAIALHKVIGVLERVEARLGEQRVVGEL